MILATLEFLDIYGIITASMGFLGKKKASIDLSRKGSPFVPAIGKGLTAIIVPGLLLASLFAAYHYYRVASELRASRPGIVSPSDQDPVTLAIAEVERHILLPQGERPQVAKVTDLAPLANIPFFGNALLGDQVIVYCKASLSILYSPSREKVIEVSRTPVAGSCPKQ